MLILTLAALAIAAPAAAQTLSLTGYGGQSATLTATELAAMPHVRVAVDQHGQKHSFDGVLLADVLDKVGAPRGDAIRGPELATVVRFTAKDGYQVVLALADSDMATRASRIIVADRDGGQPLKADEGPFRLVVEGDLRPARSARQIERIEVLRLATTTKGGLGYRP